ncbi:hypothetical protein AB0467_23510 [Streptomyces sp. NPDC052095]|uniref:hypothetical protein n=1 Tax=unclassified Streptomyces TaxID=2593676 RepID=UPI00344DCB36
MSRSEPPRGIPGTTAHARTLPESPPGAPSRALRIRAAGGWERFMRRIEAREEPEE